MNKALLERIATQLEILFKAALLSIPQKTALSNSALINSVETTTAENTIELWAFEYAIFIDSGRKVGARRVPLAALLYWIKRYNINKGTISDNSLAFLIQRAIFEHGIKPRPYLQKFTDQAVELVAKLLTEDFTAQLTKTFDLLYKK